MFTVYFGYLEFVVLICIQKESIVGSCLGVCAGVEGSVPIIFLLVFHCNPHIGVFRSPLSIQFSREIYSDGAKSIVLYCYQNEIKIIMNVIFSRMGVESTTVAPAVRFDASKRHVL